MISGQHALISETIGDQIKVAKPGMLTAWPCRNIRLKVVTSMSVPICGGFSVHSSHRFGLSFDVDIRSMVVRIRRYRYNVPGLFYLVDGNGVAAGNNASVFSLVESRLLIDGT